MWSVGGVLMPVDDPALKDYERKKMTILGIDKEKGKIVIYTEEPLTAEKTIVFIGSSIYCKSEQRYVNYDYISRFEAKTGTDIVVNNESKEGISLYLWLNPQETFVKDHRVGDILIFIEI